jgi:glycosyltransferase involved in cell wall biosynthesis
MKIAIIAGTFFPYSGGVQVEIHNMANRLVKNGHSVDVYVFKNIKLKNNFYRIIKINYLFLSLLYILKKFFNLKLHKFFYLFNFRYIELDHEIYHFHFLNFKSLILIEYLKYFKKKVLVTFHGADIQIKKNINYGFRLDKKFNFYLKEIIRKVDGIQCISKNIYEDLTRLNIKRKIIYLIPNSISVKKRQYNNKKDQYINLITVGRYARYKKGYDLVSRIAKRLVEKNIKFKWEIIGENSHMIYEDEYISKHKDKIISIDNIKNINETYFPASKLLRHYSKANLYINLARIESFGLTFIESLACNTPIISFRSKGINEIIINKKNGFFIKDINSLVDKINELHLNRQLLKRLSLNSPKTVKKFYLDKNYKKLVNFYNKFSN